MRAEQLKLRRAENDMAWKQILAEYLKDFIEFFWPEAHVDIDWDQPYTPLEQEFNKIASNDQIGNKYVDKLFKVFLKNGQEQWCLLHLEIQHSKDLNFAKRMLIYFSRIFNQYGQRVASFALLADHDKSWRPEQFHDSIWGSTITRAFKTVKIIDYQGQEPELTKSNNPFALVVMAQLAALTTTPNQESRLISKTELIKFLFKHGWSNSQIKSLYVFLDAVLVLNEKLEVEYLNIVKQLEEANNMHITTTAERHGFKAGKQEGEAEFLAMQIKAKFKEIPAEYQDQINKADTTTLMQWGINVLNANSIADVFKV